MRFGIEPNSLIASIGGVLAILMGNAWGGLHLEARPKIWFGPSTAIAAMWSLFSGAVLRDLIFHF